MSLSIINDNLVTPSALRSKLSQSTASSVPVEVTTSFNFHTNGFGTNNSTYYYCTGNAPTIALTFPASYSNYRGKIVHVSNHTSATAAITVAAAGAASGTVTSVSGGTLNGGNLIAATGGWVTLVCDGSTGWVAVMSE